MFDDLVEDISESWTASGSTEAEEDSSAVGEAVDVATDDPSLWKSEEKFPAMKNNAETDKVSGFSDVPKDRLTHRDGIKSEKNNLPVRSQGKSRWISARNFTTLIPYPSY